MLEPSHYIMLVLFVAGYAAIIFEHRVRVNKSAASVLLAGCLWTVLYISAGGDHETVHHQLGEHVSDVSEIVFFLLGAMTLVEVIDSHGAFKLVTDRIRTRSKRKVMCLIGIIAFFMSAILDNLTTTIVMVSLLKRIIPTRKDRLLLGGLVVVTANAGGAWTPMGDVTTTMLWIGGQITAGGVMRSLLLPSLVAMLVSLALFSLRMKGNFAPGAPQSEGQKVETGAKRVLSLGIGAFLFVPVFKAATHMPPFMGILIGLGMMWLVTDLLHNERPDTTHVRVPHALTKVDVSGVFFFLGILLSVGALQSAGILSVMAAGLDQVTSGPVMLATVIGLLSAVVDNVPLVAGAMGMYTTTQYPVDGQFWQLMAFCAGTGGSVLVIGSAAGVAFMGMQKVDFLWYVRKISPVALAGYAAGIATYLAIS